MLRSNTIKINFCFPSDSSIEKGKEGVVDSIARLIQDDKKIGFAGYLNREDLCRDLNSFIFGTSKSINLPDLKGEKREIKHIIMDTIKKCRAYIKIPSLYIFVFPTQDPFVIKEMGRVNGFTPYKKTIHIYISPNLGSKWQEYLASTVTHEIAHVLSREQFQWNTILDSLIFEGLAEHFREQVLGGEKMPWVTAINKKNITHIIKNLGEENLLKSNNNNLYLDLFFGGKRFVKWSGYTVGYIIIQAILKYGNYKVTDLLQENPDTVFMLYKMAVKRQNR